MKVDYVVQAQLALEEEKYRRHEIPSLILNLLQSNQWQERNPADKKLEPKSFVFFPNFVEESRPWGLNIEWNFVVDLCRGYDEVELALAKAITAKPTSNNTNQVAQHTVRKTNKQRQLMQLEKHRPDLLARVQEGELSANAAMIEAGFIQPKIKAIKAPENIAEMIKKHFDAEEIAKIIKYLMAQ